MVGGVFYEHGHRMIAASVGALTLLLSLWLARAGTGVLRRLGWWALAVVVVQGLLGGLTVILRLPALVSIAHACLGQIFFAVMVAIAVLANTPPQEADPAQPYEAAAKLRRLALLTAAFIFLQLLAGATLRHTGRGLHVHLAGAVVVAVHVVLLGRRVIREIDFSEWIRRPAWVALSLTGVQVLLGFHAWLLPAVGITVAHVGTGALLLASAVVIAIQSYRKVVPA
jgi:cytochrome c oxidase assembly protein subunit 15